MCVYVFFIEGQQSAGTPTRRVVCLRSINHSGACRKIFFTESYRVATHNTRTRARPWGLPPVVKVRVAMIEGQRVFITPQLGCVCLFTLKLLWDNAEEAEEVTHTY